MLQVKVRLAPKSEQVLSGSNNGTFKKYDVSRHKQQYLRLKQCMKCSIVLQIYQDGQTLSLLSCVQY